METAMTHSFPARCGNKVRILKAMTTIKHSAPVFFLALEDVSKQTLNEFKITLCNVDAKRVGDVTINDLCSVAEYPNGVYFYFDSLLSRLQYVGKCTSRSFIERVPAHFDQRPSAWLNTLPTKLVHSKNKGYPEALAEALNFRIVLLGIRDTAPAKALENVFRHLYEPVLNTPKRIKSFDGESTLAEITNNALAINALLSRKET